MIDTTINPGAWQKRKKKTIRHFLGNLYGIALEGNTRKLWHYFLSEGLNMINERTMGLLKSTNKLYCPFCNAESRSFIHISNEREIKWNSACPSCNSRSRHRGLRYLYEEILDGHNNRTRVLHFAPEPILADFIRRKYKEIEYFTTDFILEDVDFRNEDIQKLSFSDQSFDIIFCNHVIEHVEDDDAAISEMARVLRGGGIAVITIPGDWNQKETYYFPDLRHNGHYRHYGLDIVEKLEKHFSSVLVKNLHDYDNIIEGHSLAIPLKEYAFICTK